MHSTAHHAIIYLPVCSTVSSMQASEALSAGSQEAVRTCLRMLEYVSNILAGSADMEIQLAKDILRDAAGKLHGVASQA